MKKLVLFLSKLKITIGKFFVWLFVLAVLGLSLGDALTGHGIVGGNINPLIAGTGSDGSGSSSSSTEPTYYGCSRTLFEETYEVWDPTIKKWVISAFINRYECNLNKGNMDYCKFGSTWYHVASGLITECYIQMQCKFY